MAGHLQSVANMRRTTYFILILILLTPSLLPAQPQEDRRAGVNARGIVESAEISGSGQDEVGQDIREAVQKLVGQAFDQQSADDLVLRIQMALPDVIVTTRLVAGDQSDRVRVLFVLEKKNEEPAADSNVNSRYIVERVEIQGYDESKLSQSLAGRSLRRICWHHALPPMAVWVGGAASDWHPQGQPHREFL